MSVFDRMTINNWIIKVLKICFKKYAIVQMYLLKQDLTYIRAKVTVCLLLFDTSFKTVKSKKGLILCPILKRSFSKIRKHSIISLSLEV